MKNYYEIPAEQLADSIGFNFILTNEFVRPCVWYSAPAKILGSGLIAIGHFMDDHAPSEPHFIVTAASNAPRAGKMLAKAFIKRTSNHEH